MAIPKKILPAAAVIALAIAPVGGAWPTKTVVWAAAPRGSHLVRLDKPAPHFKAGMSARIVVAGTKQWDRTVKLFKHICGDGKAAAEMKRTAKP